MEAKAYGTGYVRVPLGAEVICETEKDSRPLPCYKAYDGSCMLIEPRLHEPVLIISNTTVHVAGLRYRTVANGDSTPFEIQPYRLYKIRKICRGDGWSFSGWRIEEV